jgi:hypothetical protein
VTEPREGRRGFSRAPKAECGCFDSDAMKSTAIAATPLDE